MAGTKAGVTPMRLRLTTDDRKYLEEIASTARCDQPNGRKARALLGLASGDTPDSVSMHVGIKKEQLESLVQLVKERGLEGIGLGRSARKRSGQSRARQMATIEKTAGVCGGAARLPAHGSRCGNLSKRTLWAPRKPSS